MFGTWTRSEQISLLRLVLAFIAILFSINAFGIFLDPPGIRYSVERIVSNDIVLSHCIITNHGGWANEVTIVIETMNRTPISDFHIKNLRRNEEVTRDPRNGDPIHHLGLKLPYLAQGESITIVVETAVPDEVICKPAAKDAISKIESSGTVLRPIDLLLVSIVTTMTNAIIIVVIYFGLGLGRQKNPSSDERQ